MPTQKNILRSFFLLCWQACLCAGLAQTPHPAFRHYSTNDGLASPEVYCILQDRKGYIWIATDNGVSRFDGYEFRNYGPADGLLENVVFRLQLDDLGRVWMQGMSGKLYYTEGDTILSYWNNYLLDAYQTRINKGYGFLVQGIGDTVHIGTAGMGILTFTRFHLLPPPPRGEPFHYSAVAREGKFAFSYFGSGVVAEEKRFSSAMIKKQLIHPIYFNTKNANWRTANLHYDNPNAPGSPIEICRINDDSWLVFGREKVWHLEGNNLRQQVFFPHMTIHSGLMQNGRFFLGLHRQEGFQTYSSLDAFWKGKMEDHWLKGKSVSWFLEDQAGGKWFATNRDGLFYAAGESLRIYDSETGLPDAKVTALAMLKGKTIYAGLENGEIWRLDLKTGSWASLPRIPGNLHILDLHFDEGAGQLMAANNFFFYLEEDGWKSIPLGSESLFPSNRITVSPDGRRLWSAYTLAIGQLDPRRKTVSFYLNQRSFRIHASREDFSGRVWVGKPQGLFEFKDGQLHDRRALHPAFTLRVEDIALAPDSTLVVATKGGGIVFWKNGQFEQITTAQGLTSDMLRCVYVDENGITWAGTLHGLNRITGSWGKRKVKRLTVTHGLPSNEINRIAADGNQIWVATNGGLVNFTDKDTKNPVPQPIIASVLANQQLVDSKIRVHLPFRKRNLTIQFLAINYRMNARIPYRYRIDDGRWGNTFNTSVELPDLFWGDHHFEVQAQNEDGIWSESTVFKFTIRPPWWGAWWFIIFLLALLGSVINVSFKYRTRQLKKQHQLLVQMTELERSALQAQMNPHFIFNCLNSIQNFILQNEKEQAAHYLSTFANLIRGSLNASAKNKVTLGEEIQMLNNYLSLERMRFKNRFDFLVEIAEHTDTIDIEIPPLLIQPYVENAIVHGMKDAKGEGMIKVFFEEKDDYLHATIEDNGPGLQTERASELPGYGSDGSSTQPHGMSITQKRLVLLEGSKDVSAVFRIEEIRGDSGQVAGTKVSLRIKL